MLVVGLDGGVLLRPLRRGDAWPSFPLGPPAPARETRARSLRSTRERADVSSCRRSAHARTAPCSQKAWVRCGRARSLGSLAEVVGKYRRSSAARILPLLSGEPAGAL